MILFKKAVIYWEQLLADSLGDGIQTGPEPPARTIPFIWKIEILKILQTRCRSKKRQSRAEILKIERPLDLF